MTMTGSASVRGRRGAHRVIGPGLAFSAGALLATASFLVAGAGPQSDATPAATAIDEEPVLFWDVAGFGFGGPVHERLAVYTSGLVTYAYGGVGTEDGAACFTYATPDAIASLAAELREAGAFTVADAPAVVLDVPTTTVTVFRSVGRGESRARTFSFNSPTTAQLAEIGAIVEQFRLAQLPEGTCSGSGW
jgi:hypothetical protein